MKKIWIGLAVLSIVALSFGAASYAYAQSGSNPWGGFHNPGMMGSGYGDHSEYGYGMMSRGFGPGMMGAEDGPMHDAMITAFADALGLSPEELEARHDDGETLWQIADALGLSESDIQTLMVTARDAGLAQAVADGQLTQEQADGMLSHMGAGMGAGTFGGGSCDGSAGGFHGHGMKGHGMNWDASAGARP